MSEFILDLESKEYNKFLLKSLPEALLDNNPKAKAKSILLSHLQRHNLYLQQKVMSLENNLEETRLSLTSLSENLKALKRKSLENDKTIELINTQSVEKDQKIQNLESELSKSNILLDYKTNDNERQIQGVRTEIVTKVKRHTKIVLDDLIHIANEIPSNEGDELKLWVENLKTFFDQL